MDSPRRISNAPWRRRALLLVGVGLVALAGLSCKDSSVPPSDDVAGNNWDPDQTELTFTTEGPDGSVSELVLLATNITWAPGSGILRAEVALHNAGQDAIPGPDNVEVFDFSPPDVVPLNAVCGIVPGPCWFEYSGAYGGDGILGPGETSEAREWQIVNTRGTGFAFRTRLGSSRPIEGRIAGVVFNDRDRNGDQSANEAGIAGVTVLLTSPSGFWSTTTGERGHYEFHVQQEGVYKVVKQVPDGATPTTPTELSVVVFDDINGNLSNFDDAHFGCLTRTNTGPGIAVQLFLDGNRNWRRDPNETGLPGHVTVIGFAPERRGDEPCVHDPIEVPISRDGRAYIPATDIGCEPPWLVQRGPLDIEDPNTNLTFLVGTSPRDQVVHGFPVPPQDVEVSFGMAPPDSSQNGTLIVDGKVFIDTNENGVHEPNEPWATGVRLELLSPCDRLESTWVNGNGYYRFEPPGTDWCPIGGVAVSGGPDATTTTNPVLFDPPNTPGVHRFRVDFGVRPR